MLKDTNHPSASFATAEKMTCHLTGPRLYFYHRLILSYEQYLFCLFLHVVTEYVGVRKAVLTFPFFVPLRGADVVEETEFHQYALLSPLFLSCFSWPACSRILHVGVIFCIFKSELCG